MVTSCFRFRCFCFHWQELCRHCGDFYIVLFVQSGWILNKYLFYMFQQNETLIWWICSKLITPLRHGYSRAKRWIWLFQPCPCISGPPQYVMEKMLLLTGAPPSHRWRNAPFCTLIGVAVSQSRSASLLLRTAEEKVMLCRAGWTPRVHVCACRAGECRVLALGCSLSYFHKLLWTK